MRKRIFSLWVGVIVLVAVAMPAAMAELERVGPVNPAHGYPAWYQDKTGLTLEFMSPMNQAELSGGWTLLLPTDIPSGTAPETFPTNFAEEHFYWAADAGIDYTTLDGGRSKALLVLALEAAFGIGPVAEGDQVVFGRIRVRFDPPYSGDYIVYTPYCAWTLPDQVAGERVFVTEDIGFNAPAGTFDAALYSHVGPFLLPSDTPGGAELPPIPGPVTGKLYIADPVRSGPVTGSPLAPFTSAVDGLTRDHNIFRIEGPNGFVIETTDFTLVGRVFTGTIPGRIDVERATYARTAELQKIDVFATAYSTTQGRIPGSPKPPSITPILSFFNAPPAVDPITGELTSPPGETDFQMFGVGSTYWGQSQPAQIPLEVTIEDETSRDANGQVVPTFLGAPVTDQVVITEAYYDPTNGGSLSVRAHSSDEVEPPVLKLGGYGELVNGEIIVAPLAAPPSKVSVLSSAGGYSERQVMTGVGTPSGGNVPVAVNDYTSTNEDEATTINVLANDTINGSPIIFGPDVAVTIVGPPRLGVAAVDADGSIAYTPNPNVTGTEGIAYTVSVNGLTSSLAYVTIVINPVNDQPVAVDDSFSTVVGTSTLNVLANDTDVDGQTDLTDAVIVTQPQEGATVTGGSVVTFVVTAPGAYTFTYRARDAVGMESSNIATVTVNVAAAETITVTQAEYRTTQSRLRISGTDSLPAGQTLTITYEDGSAAGTVIASPVVDGAGLWAVDIRPATGILDPRTTGATRILVTSPLGGTTSASISIRR